MSEASGCRADVTARCSVPDRQWTLPLALVLSLGFACGGGVQAANLLSPGIGPAELDRRLGAAEPPLLVDVRSPTEYSAGHIRGAINIPAPTLNRHLDEIRGAADPILYCNDTRFTRFSEQLLMKNGVKRFSHLEGGLQAWEAAGLPVENSLP